MSNRQVYLTLFIVLVISLATISEPVVALENRISLSQQRKDFVAARDALTNGRVETFKRMSRWLESYPLYGYLRYDYLSPRLHRTTDVEIREFILTYADSSISHRLHNKWLFNLARRKRWGTFLEEYNKGENKEKGNVKLYCYSLQARLKLKLSAKARKEIMEEINTLWLQGNSQPKDCDPVFEFWKAQGGMTEEALWKRIRLAMDNKKISLARYLSKSLNSSGRKWVEYWMRMHKRPAAMLGHSAFEKDTSITRNILKHGIKRLARIEIESAITEWQRLKKNHTFNDKEVAELDRHLALTAAYRNHPSASEWLGLLLVEDDVVTPWRIRALLANQNWSEALSRIEALPEIELSTDRWQYWHGRALHEIGVNQTDSTNVAKVKKAEKIFNKISNHRSYYGFLAADRLEKAYNFEIESVAHQEHELSQVVALPTMTRAYELYRLGFTVEARREWQFGLKSMDKRQLQLAAVLASRWGWYDRAILTVAKSEHFSDLDIRFPMAYKKQVVSSARRYRIDPAWVYGVLRQESAFMTDARSSAGALGLMQLMPGTARLTAKLLKLPMRNKYELLEADKNIRLGSGYLKHMLDKHNGHQVLATAAYNAGPHRVKKWIPKHSGMPADLWVETIPFSETRRYIKNVMAFTTIFDKRLDGKHIALSKRMPEIYSKK
ncbi:MAG: transglycosylase SLT domain-containing protein [Gammaproteobacteria bacterium]|nr:transglycosylase SLT domain-containing protein [Gammaproteobacteria bacterium]